MVTMESADNALKSLYLDVVADQLNYSVNPFLAKIKHSTQDVWGKEVRRVARHGLNGGIGAGTETGTLPKANSEKYDQFVLPLKNLYGTIEISDKALRASENNTGAFVNLLNAEMEGLLKAARYHFGRMLFGDGRGVLANFVKVEGPDYVLDDVSKLKEGMVIDFVTKFGGIAKNGGAKTIVDIDPVNKKIRFDGGFVDSEDIPNIRYVVLQNSYKNELTGLGAIFGNGSSIYGLERERHKWLNPKTVNVGGEINDSVIQRAIDELEEDHGSKVNFILCSSGVKRAYQKYLSTYRRNVDYMDLKGGFKALSYNGIPVISDKFCPKGTMYLLNSDDFTLYQLCDWKWLEGENGKVIKQVPNKPVYTATLVKYADLMCSRPCGQAVLQNITED